MNHHPFEKWILSGDHLDTNQQEKLHSHLKSCAHCRDLSRAAEQVITLFTVTPAPGPVPGFTQRWHQRLAQQRIKVQQQRLTLIPLGLLFLAGVILASLIILNFSQIDWMIELTRLIANLSLVVSRYRQVIFFSQTITQSLPQILPVMIFALLSLCIGMFAMTVTWFSTIFRLYFKNQEGVIQQ